MVGVFKGKFVGIASVDECTEDAVAEAAKVLVKTRREDRKKVWLAITKKKIALLDRETKVSELIAGNYKYNYACRVAATEAIMTCIYTGVPLAASIL